MDEDTDNVSHARIYNRSGAYSCSTCIIMGGGIGDWAGEAVVGSGTDCGPWNV